MLLEHNLETETLNVVNFPRCSFQSTNCGQWYMCIEDDILTTTNGYKCNSKEDCYLREISVSTLMIYPTK